MSFQRVVGASFKLVMEVLQEGTYSSNSRKLQLELSWLIWIAILQKPWFHIPPSKAQLQGLSEQEVQKFKSFLGFGISEQKCTRCNAYFKIYTLFKSVIIFPCFKSFQALSRLRDSLVHALGRQREIFRTTIDVKGSKGLSKPKGY